MPESRKVMELYTDTAYKTSRLVTRTYSTSFTSSIGLFPKESQKHIYALYGLVRLADEIVDTYKGPDSTAQLDALEQETYRAIKSGYSTNLIVHAFATTARLFSIDRSLIEPFFASMRFDTRPWKELDETAYHSYIDGSAEVVGLMLLKVFVDDTLFKKLEEGARHLGAAYQKVNFLRDIAADHHELGRWYFPAGSFKTFDESQKRAIIADIENDFSIAQPAIKKLPPAAQSAVNLSFRYYTELLKRLKQTDARALKTTRVRVPDIQKLGILFKAKIGRISL